MDGWFGALVPVVAVEVEWVAHKQVAEAVVEVEAEVDYNLFVAAVVDAAAEFVAAAAVVAEVFVVAVDSAC